MKKTMEVTVEKELLFDVTPDGTIRTIYKDSNVPVIKSIGEISKIARASNVEWEVIENPINARFPATQGWSVRAAHDPELALRVESSPLMGSGYLDTVKVSRDNHLAVILFSTREVAILCEEEHFFELLPPRKES